MAASTDWHAVFCYVFAFINFAYAAIAIFFIESFCEQILFGYASPTGHAWQYFTRGAGLVCLGISAIGVLLIDAPNQLAIRHSKFQILNWTMWCCWEAHWLVVGASNTVAGIVQFVVCFITLFLAMQAYKYCDDVRMDEEEKKRGSTLRGVLEGNNTTPANRQ